MLLSSVRRVYDKRLSGHFGNFPLAFIMCLFSMIPLAAMLLFFPIPKDVVHLPWQFWWPLLLSSLIYPLQIYCYIRAIREGEMSAVIPLVTLAPLFNIATSFLLVGEVPSILGFAGIVIVVTAVYFLLKKKGVRMRSRPELFMILSMFLLAASSSLDKVAIQVSTPIWYAFMNNVISIILLGVLVFITREYAEMKKIKPHFGSFVIVGLLLSVSYATLEIAISLGPTSYVLAIRSGVFILSALWGIFKLKESMSSRKLAALGLFIVGSILLAFA